MATITPFTGALPGKNQSEVAFNANVTNILAYIATLAPQLNQLVSEVVVGANVQLWVAGTTYYPPKIVAGSDGLRYSLTAGVGVLGDNPVGSTTGRWVKIALDESSIDAAPPGAVFMHFGDIPLDGTLELDGSAVSRASYSRLFAIYGTMYGAGNGTTTFNLPDPRGLFPRVWDHGAGIDPNATTRTDRGDGTTGDNIGTKQADAYRSHSHTLTGHSDYVRTGGSWALSEAGTGQSTSASGGNETRPANINAMLCVKY